MYYNTTISALETMCRNEKLITDYWYMQLQISAEEIVGRDEGVDGKNHECQERYDNGAVRHVRERIAPPVVDPIAYSSSC